MPEESPARTIATAAVLGALGDLPGFGAVAGAIQGAIQAAARQRDEDFLAMVSARISSLEAWTEGAVDLGNPEFLASAHRLFRAAQETADDDKRARLAAALAHAGPWSTLPRDERERMQRFVADLTTREVGLLKIFAAPGQWLRDTDREAYESYSGMFTGSFVEFLLSHVAIGDPGEMAAVEAANEHLQESSLAGLWNREPVGRQQLFSNKLSDRGGKFLQYLEEIEQ